MHLSVILLLCLPLVRSWWVGLERLTFEEARSACSPGDLATFSTNQELSDLLWTNQELRPALALTNHSAAFFWIGLEKPKDLCVVPDLDQRGFRFVDGRAKSELNIWREEPRDTCTNVRCGAVALDSRSWGLVSLSCKNKNHFICGPAESGPRPESPPKSTPVSTPKSTPMSTPKFTSGTTPESRPDPRPETRPEGPIVTRGPNEEQARLSPGLESDPGLESAESPESGLSSDPTQMGPTPEPGLTSDPEPPPDHNPDQDPSPLPPSPEERADPVSGHLPNQTPAPSAAPGPDSDLGPSSGPSCEPANPVVPGSRFLYDSEPGQVSVECWSGEVLLLRCVHGVWTRIRPDSEPDPSPVSDLAPDMSSRSGPALNRSEAWSESLICSDCGPGLRFRDGVCDDIDECSLSPAPCPHGCVNERGSFTCTPAPLSNALVHSLIAVAAVMLAVIAMVTVWCCVRKRRREQKSDQDLNQNQTEA